jgi:hypothetical protein
MQQLGISLTFTFLFFCDWNDLTLASIDLKNSSANPQDLALRNRLVGAAVV